MKFSENHFVNEHARSRNRVYVGVVCATEKTSIITHIAPIGYV